MKDVKDRAVLITGAGMGMGRLFALKFSRAHARPLLVDVDREALERTASELGGTAHTYVCDISKIDEVGRLAELVHRDAGMVDVIVNNAGVLYGGPFLKTSDELIERTIDVNIKGTMFVTRAFLPDLVARKQGHIVTMASGASLTGVPDLVAYSTSKHGIVGFSESIRLEMRKYGLRDIRLTLAFPYFVKTGMTTGVRTHVLLDPQDVVDRIFDAVLKDRPSVYLPGWLRLVPIVFRVLPESVGDWLLFKTGVGRTMEHWTGHGEG
ncbi:MAG: SDR family oxidoreductase [Deltaproteobacteria bacterium]|nr:SDR family oxidoreductase [Deltaproteobacteria bacterium]